MTALPGHSWHDPTAPDSERLLRTFGGWQREWDESAIQAEQEPEYHDQVKYAVELYGRGFLPIEVRWELAERYGRACSIGRVQKAAERAIQAVQEQPPELRRALVAHQRQKAIQGALQDRAWGPAGAMLARAGEVAGELGEELGLSPEDLRLTVEIEDETPTLPADQRAAIQGEPEPAEDDCQ